MKDYMTIPASVYRIVLVGFDGVDGVKKFIVHATNVQDALDIARSRLSSEGKWAVTACENMGPSA